MEKSLFMKKISTKLLKSNVLPFNFTFWTTSITINIVSIISISWIVVESNPITSNLFSDVFCLSVSSSSPTYFYVSAWASSIIITCVTVIAICAWSSVSYTISTDFRTNIFWWSISTTTSPSYFKTANNTSTIIRYNITIIAICLNTISKCWN